MYKKYYFLIRRATTTAPTPIAISAIVVGSGTPIGPPPLSGGGTIADDANADWSDRSIGNAIAKYFIISIPYYYNQNK